MVYLLVFVVVLFWLVVYAIACRTSKTKTVKEPPKELPVLTSMEKPKGLRRGTLNVLYVPTNLVPPKPKSDFSECPNCGSCYSFREGICLSCNPRTTFWASAVDEYRNFCKASGCVCKSPTLTNNGGECGVCGGFVEPDPHLSLPVPYQQKPGPLDKPEPKKIATGDDAPPENVANLNMLHILKFMKQTKARLENLEKDWGGKQ